MKISIIIPTYNEEQTIAKLIEYLKTNSNSKNIAEIIVSDGDSEDATCELAEKASSIVIHGAEKGRAIQMNYGAKKATGDILYFLHADSFPPKFFDKAIIKEVQKGNESGCFRMQFDSNSKWLLFWSWFTKFKANICRGGDQSLFVTKNLFKKIEGFDENLILMEDTEIITRLKKDTNFVVIADTIVTSARRYEENGQYKLQIIFGVIHLLARFGFSQKWLSKFYKKSII